MDSDYDYNYNTSDEECDPWEEEEQENEEKKAITYQVCCSLIFFKFYNFSLLESLYWPDSSADVGGRGGGGRDHGDLPDGRQDPAEPLQVGQGAAAGEDLLGG